MIIALGLLVVGLYLIFGSERNVDALIKEHIADDKKKSIDRESLLTKV